MYDNVIVPPVDIIYEIIPQNGLFPNNPVLPLVLYKKALRLSNDDPETVEEIFLINEWKKPWRNGIYNYHHYHSNVHEVLGIYNGTCVVEMGGDGGPTFELEKGDVLIIPAGLAHKNFGCTEDFKCVGAYPVIIDYDMYYGKPNERFVTDKNIANVPLPSNDPVYGPAGPLFKYWK
jgi:uncharacterized protein YjlB